jgi:5-methyltetrahydrofolate--homocysteine methyltransferase
MAEELIRAIADLHEDEALRIVRERLSAGEDAFKLLADSRRAMKIVGMRFESKEYFIPDLVYSGEILQAIAEMVKPKLTGATEFEHLDKVIIGTVAGDIHDIGKNIVTFMLDINGFEVYDLGIDVPGRKFVEKAEETQARIIGLSGLLTLAFDAMKETIEVIKNAGLSDKVKIMIGGGQINDEVRKYTGADAFGTDAMSAVLLAKEWSGEK